MMKSYPQFTMDYILYELSYNNLIMLSSILPSYNSDKSEDDKQKGISSEEFFSQMKKYGKA